MTWLWIVLGVVVYMLVGWVVMAFLNHYVFEGPGDGDMFFAFVWPLMLMSTIIVEITYRFRHHDNPVQWLEKKIFKEK